MRLKPGVLQWAAVACFCVGLIYALGLEGGAQIGQPITDRPAHHRRRVHHRDGADPDLHRAGPSELCA